MVGNFENDDNKVGYRKPPKSRQFKKGASGNPSGRPKKAMDLDGGIIRELESKLIINENGERRFIKKYEAVLKQLVNKAMNGSLSAIRLLLELRRDSRERASELNERSPFDPLRQGKYTAKDLTDDELACIILGSRDKEAAKEPSHRRKHDSRSKDKD